MKLMTSALALFYSGLTLAHSLKAPEFYSAQFEVIKVQPMCPPTVPGGAVCMGLGSIVTVEANLGCADEMLFSRFEDVKNGNNVDLYAVSVVKRHPMAESIRCIRPNVIRKTITVNATGRVNLINLGIENL